MIPRFEGVAVFNANAAQLASLSDARLVKCPTGDCGFALTAPGTTGTGWCCADFLTPNGVWAAWLGRHLGEATSRRGMLAAASAERVVQQYLRGSSVEWEQLGSEFIACLWDPNARRLVLLSDPLQSFPLYYTRDSSGLVRFGSHAAKLASFRGADGAALDQSWIVASVCNLLPEIGSTCLAAVRAVPAGHVVTLDSQGVQSFRYWRPRFDEHLEPAELVHRFKARFSASVRAAVSGSEASAVALSGGLDSSSVLRVAAQYAPGRILAVTNRVEGDSLSDELAYAQAALRGTGVRLVQAHAVDPVCNDTMLACASEPDEVERYPFWAMAARVAAAEGQERLISGAYGDLVGGGANLCRSPVPLVQRISSMGAALNNSETFGRAAKQVLLQVVPELRPFFRLQSMKFGRSVERPAVLSDEGNERLRAFYRQLVEEDQFSNADCPPWLAVEAAIRRTFGFFNRASRLVESLTGIALLHPFGTPELLQLASATPRLVNRTVLGDRYLLRSAMAGLLPDEVRLRTTKSYLNAFFDPFRQESLKSDRFRQGGTRLQHLLAAPWERLIARAISGNPPRPLLHATFIVGLIGAWLHEHGI